MHVLLGLVATVAVALGAPFDDVSPIEIEAGHEAVAWSVELRDRETSCRARAWIGRMGEQPLAILFAVDLDDEVVATAEGETPLYGLPAGTYDLHFESDGCRGQFTLVFGPKAGSCQRARGSTNSGASRPGLLTAVETANASIRSAG